jgi:aminoglycoside phosphotransferase (APT) family kinase protein
MAKPELSPSPGALEEVRRLAGPAAAVESVARLEGGQHADTWRVDCSSPELAVVVREFPAGDPAAGHEQQVLRALDGLGGLAPVLLGGDLDGLWSERPTTLISRLDGEADITPADRDWWAVQLGRALAQVHAVPGDRVSGLPSVLDRGGSAHRELVGPLAARVRSRWSQIAAAEEVLTHGDYWSGNVVARDGRLTGIVDWTGASRGPRGYDVGWCRLDLVLLFDERVADVFLAAYEQAAGHTLGDVALWDAWSLARSHEIVDTWEPNYAPLGRPDLTAAELRRLHSQWTESLLGRV